MQTSTRPAASTPRSDYRSFYRLRVVVALCAAPGMIACAFAAGIASVPAAASPSGAGAFAAPAETNGWLARVSKPGAGRKGEMRAYLANASFALEPGQGLVPGAPVDAFEVALDANVKIAAEGKYRFGAEMEGGAYTVTVFGGSLREPVVQKVSAGRGDRRMGKWVDLQPGTVNVQYVFTRESNARVRFRAMWEKQGIGKNGFRAESIPFESTTPIGLGSQDVSAWLTAEHGRALLGEMGCVSCHAGAGVETVTLRRPAPLLGGLAGRINPDWAKKWMVAPQSLKPGSGMPSVLTTVKRAEDAENITAFLLSTGGTFHTEAVATEPASVEIGRRAFTSFGCVACHGVPGARGGKAPNPLTNLAGKWNASALSEFLLDPLKWHPAGRMPSLNLNRQEADAIATYLINAWGPETLKAAKHTEPQASRVALGKAAFSSLGCASCHQLGEGMPDVTPTLSAKPLAELDPKAGCLNPTDQQTPRYQLSSEDRASLAAAISQIKGWTLPGASGAAPMYPVDSTRIAFDAMGCRNCHQRDGVGGVAADLNGMFITLAETDLGDEGRLPPRLNGVGAKLNSQWLTRVLTEGARARPYMAARMPVFGEAHIAALIKTLAQSDGVWPNSDRLDPKVDDARVQFGRRLVGEKGLNCISCHVFGNNPPAGTPGPDVTMFAARLRYEWWADYIQAPARFKPGTRMPAFFESGSSNVSDVLGGDPDLQADALWAYFTLGESAPEPEGLTPQGGYRIKVGARPMVLRAFLKEAGSRGIAVGYPEAMGGIHFAFDAERVRLVDAWKGDFIDASGSWAGRGGSTVGGQGPRYWTAPPGPAIVIASERPAQWPSASGREAGTRFRGYRLDHNGVPSFMYTIGAGAAGVNVTERFEPTPEGAITRTFEISPAPEGAKVWINAGPNSRVASTSANATMAGTPETGIIGIVAKNDSMPVVVTIEAKP